jgi:pyruvate formate lyase activating enzyme
MQKKARFYTTKNNKISCQLCAHNCQISQGKTGICKVRKNIDGKLYNMIYGLASGVAADPVEKKPLYHFYPGTNAFSLGAVGCNFNCRHCQNFEISTANSDFRYLKKYSPLQTVELAKQYNCQGIAYTYNEPTIWHEFCFDSAKLAKKADLYTIYVTNGYINEEPLRELSLVLDAMNVDVKAFDDEFYKDICQAKLAPVLDTCIIAKELDIHIELTYLIIPTLNDGSEELSKFSKWVVENLGKKIPIHFSRFHPDFNLRDIGPTPMKTMFEAYKIAKDAGNLYVYLGNVSHDEYENTICPNCKNLCIERFGYNINLSGLKNGKCSRCGQDLDIVI